MDEFLRNLRRNLERRPPSGYEHDDWLALQRQLDAQHPPSPPPSRWRSGYRWLLVVAVIAAVVGYLVLPPDDVPDRADSKLVGPPREEATIRDNRNVIKAPETKQPENPASEGVFETAITEAIPPANPPNGAIIKQNDAFIFRGFPSPVTTVETPTDEAKGQGKSEASVLERNEVGVDLLPSQSPSVVASQDLPRLPDVEVISLADTTANRFVNAKRRSLSLFFGSLLPLGKVRRYEPRPALMGEMSFSFLESYSLYINGGVAAWHVHTKNFAAGLHAPVVEPSTAEAVLSHIKLRQRSWLLGMGAERSVFAGGRFSASAGLGLSVSSAYAGKREYQFELANGQETELRQGPDKALRWHATGRLHLNYALSHRWQVGLSGATYWSLANDATLLPTYGIFGGRLLYTW